MLALVGVLDDDLVSADLVVVEGVERLTHLVQDEVGDVHHVVDGAQTDGSECVLQPFGRLLDSHAGDADARVTRSAFFVFDSHFDRQVRCFGSERCVGFAEREVHAVCLIIGVQVARDAEMAGSVRAVGRDVHLDEVVALHVVVLRCGDAHGCIGGQFDDAVVAGADAYLVFRAQHAEGLDAADLGFLDGERVVAAVEDRAERGHDDVQSLAAVGCAADDLQRVLRRSGFGLSCAVGGLDGHCGDMQVVGVGMLHACEHLAGDESLQTAFDCLYFLYCTYFQTNGSQVFSYFFCAFLQVQIALQPFVRYIHFCSFFTFSGHRNPRANPHAHSFAGAKLRAFFLTLRSRRSATLCATLTQGPNPS